MENGKQQFPLFMFERIRAESISNARIMLKFSSACWYSHAVRKFLHRRSTSVLFPLFVNEK